MISLAAHWIANRPWLIIGAVVLVTAGALFALVDWSNGSLRLKVDPSVSQLLPAEDPARRYHERMQTLFGADDVVVIALADDDMLDAGGLARIESLTRALRALPEVQRVLSLATVPNLRAEGDDLDMRVFTEAGVETAAERARLLGDIEGNPLVRRQLVSADGRVAAFIVSFRDLSDEAFAAERFPTRLRALAEEHAQGAAVWITGGPIVKAAVSAAVVNQLEFTIPAIFALVAAILLVAFQSIRSVLLPVTTMLLSLLWTLAALAVLGISMNLVSSIVPPVVITLGLAYTMHLLAEFFVVRKDFEDGAERIKAMLEKVALPLLLTGVTTAAGFIALALNPLQAVREFALLSALGVGITLTLTLTLLPAMLSVFDCGRLREPPGGAFFRRASVVLSDFALRRRQLILWSGGALIGLGLIGALQIEVGTEYIRGFKPDHPVRQDYEAINQRLGGANPLAIVLEGYVDDTFVEPDMLRELRKLQGWLDEQPEVGSTQSLVDHLMLVNRSFSGGDPAYFVIPESRAEAKQLLVFGGGDAINGFVDKRFATTQIRIRARVEDSAAVGRLIARIEDRLAELPRRLDAGVTGSTVLVTRTVDDIASGQFLSIGVACIVVYFMLAALFTSWRVGLMAMWPNILPVLVYFGVLGLLGIPLSPTTSLIACIVLGVAVDDTIHFLVRFNAEARAMGNERRASAAALRSVLRPVTFTTIALCSGFLVLCFSELRNQIQFGALAAFTLAVAWITDVTFTPALGAGVRIVTLWDVLRLDLGADPQRSIRLLNGLSGRQARTFALLSRLQSFDSNTRVINEGAEARDIYLIIDGELKAWVERDGERRELSTMGRGVVMGEVGYFGQKRTANVDTVTPARVLRFNVDDLERMRLRYPRIAATIYRNLNLIQAERIANTTRMVT